MALLNREFFSFDEFELHPSARAFLRKGEKVALAPKSFEVLVCLVANAGRLVTKEELLNAVWPGAFVEESNLTQHIFWLRKAMPGTNFIATMPGRGYQFTAPVRVITEQEQEVGPDYSLQRVTEQTKVVYEETVFDSTPRPRWKALAVAIAVASVLLVASITGWGVWRWMHRVVPGDHHEVVLADFENSTGNAAFDGSLRTELAFDLEESPSLVLASETDVRSVLAGKPGANGEALTQPIALEACRALKNQAVMLGDVARSGAKFLVSLAVIDCGTGLTLSSVSTTTANESGLLDAVDQDAAVMLRKLGAKVQAKTTYKNGRPYNLASLKLYAQGGTLVSQRRCSDAAAVFEKAVAVSPRFAAAYQRLSSCQWKLYEDEKATFANQRAYDLRDEATTPVRFAIIDSYNNLPNGDLYGAVSNLQAWTTAYPLRVEAWLALAEVEQQLGQLDEAMTAAQHAMKLAPTAASYRTMAYMQMHLGEFNEAAATACEAARLHLDEVGCHYFTQTAAFLRDDEAEVNRQAAWGEADPKQRSYMLESESYIALTQGKVRRLLQLEDELSADKTSSARHREVMARDLPRMLAENGLLAEASVKLKALGPAKDHTNVMIAQILTGNDASVEADLRAEEAETPAHTNLRLIRFPQVKAVMAMAHHRPDEAVAALEPAVPYDLATLRLPYIRGLAYLAGDRPMQAEIQFRKVIDNVGLSPLNYYRPLAHLNLARALEREGNHDHSKAEYEVALHIWKDADAEFPPMLQAKAELARIK